MRRVERQICWADFLDLLGSMLVQLSQIASVTLESFGPGTQSLVSNPNRTGFVFTGRKVSMSVRDSQDMEGTGGKLKISYLVG